MAINVYLVVKLMYKEKLLHNILSVFLNNICISVGNISNSNVNRNDLYTKEIYFLNSKLQ